MRAATANRGSSQWAARYRDLLEIARLVSWCTNWEYLIRTCLDHLSQRLGTRARCVLMEGDELKLRCWVGKYECPMEQVPVCRDSIVWEVVRKGGPVNLTDPARMTGYGHTLKEQIKIKAIIPLVYVDPVSQEEKKVGALIVDPGKKGTPVSKEDFEYLKAVGELIGAAVGKAQLAEELIESYRKREAIVKETTHNFRNRIEAIGGFSRRIAVLAKNEDLAREAGILYDEAKSLEGNLREFEKYMDTGFSRSRNEKTNG